MIKRKRLIIDIETSPNVGFFWKSGYKLNIPYQNILHERAIICICCKWEGKKRIYSFTWDKKQNDKAMLKEALKLVNLADEVVAHNGDRFDIKWLRTRAIKHNLPMSPNIVTFDTLKESRSKFYFNSNRLDYLGQYLKLGKKMEHEGMDMWTKIVWYRDPVALKKMVAYCKQDVLLLEAFWKRLSPYLISKTSISEYTRDCRECGSSNTVINNRRMTAKGYKNVQMRCKDCGHYHTIAESRLEKRNQHI